jgi:superfamily II DNA or RNA helicase
VTDNPENPDPVEPAVDQVPGLQGLAFKPGYDSSDQVLDTFYVPALSRACHYDRSVGYFRSSALSVAARGMSRFINGGGTVRLLCGAEISSGDRNALLGRTTLDGAFAERLAQRLVTESEVDRRRLEVLAWLAREGLLEVRIAIAVDDQGAPLVGGELEPYFHEKIGVLRDTHGDGIAFQGSVNESATAWTINFESFSVYASWDATATHFSFWANKFEQHWAGDLKGFRVYALPDAARQRLISLAPDVVPGERDPEEPAVTGDDAVVAHFLRVAPQLAGADALAGATTGVQLFPHQRQVAARLADLYPRSWLVADEVGLGKTISAGLALRRLWLAGRVKRALILAPANVCRQWQDELFEKFGIWAPRLDRQKIHGAHPGDVHAITPGGNPYAENPLLIASSHLARRRDHQKLVLEAAPYDLLIVDEAHHARRSHIEEDRYRPNRLLELLDDIRSRGAAKALWLLTATPMQVTPIELRDLLIQAGLHGALADDDAFLRYFREVAKTDDERTAWAWLDQALRNTPRLPETGAEDVVLRMIAGRVNAVEAALIQRFGTGGHDGTEIVRQLSPAGLDALRIWLRQLSPVGQYVTRHSRETLRLYRARGELTENLAERDVQPIVIPFDAEEQALYDQLDELIDRLMEAHGTRQGAGFVLTVYRRRLTSSWAAIRNTLRRRLEKEILSLDDDLLDEAEREELDTGFGATVDDSQAVPLNDDEIAEIRGYIDHLTRVADSKFNRLRKDIDAARGAGHSTVVFTQFTDTLDDLRGKLSGAYRSQLATFTGDGGRIFREAEGWAEISKRDLVEAIKSRQVTVLLATDAASEGLNLQSCSYLINYDMPWNPMRVEQRIGRIDRLGQARDVVHIRSYFIPNTVEESVYRALASRIDDFSRLLGNLQPILGATERAFQAIFRAPRSERAAAEAKTISELLGQIGQTEREGIEFPAEDPLPIPNYAPSPVTLEDIRTVLVDRFAAYLDEPGRPVSYDPSRVSRDPEGWTALGTYGHPRLGSALARRAGPHLPDTSSLILASSADGLVIAARADRSPPERVMSLADIDELGPPASRGEAESVANSLLGRVVVARQDYENEILSLRELRQTEALRDSFVALVHATLADGCAASRYDGQPGADPILIWSELSQDSTSPWGYARAFAQRLGVPVARLYPGDLATAREPISPEEWSQVRYRSAQELLKLMEEYRQSASSD